MIGRLFLVEVLKLRGSLAALLMVLAPGLIGVACFLGPVVNERAPKWSELLEVGFTLWASFMLPMTVTALTTLMAQIEYKPKAWDHLLSLPVRRSRIYLAKAMVVIAAVAFMTALVFVFVWLGGALGGLAAPERAPTGAFTWAGTANAGARTFGASLLMVMLLLWTALRFASFVVPLSAGIAATLVGFAVAVTRTDKADYFPTLLPMNAVMKTEPEPYLALGIGGGLLVLALMVVDLSRREMR